MVVGLLTYLLHWYPAAGPKLRQCFSIGAVEAARTSEWDETKGCVQTRQGILFGSDRLTANGSQRRHADRCGFLEKCYPGFFLEWLDPILAGPRVLHL